MSSGPDTVRAHSLAGDRSRPPPDGHRLALSLRGPGQAPEPRLTSAAFLAESRWLLSGFFHWIVAHPLVLRVVDLLNVWASC